MLAHNSVHPSWLVCFINSIVPDRVSGVRFVPSANENTLSVEWSRPRSDTPILYYEIRSRQRDQSWQGPVTATTEMVNLRRNVVPLASYGVQVRAVSAIGAGPYSREEILEGFLQHLHKCTHISCTQAHMMNTWPTQVHTRNNECVQQIPFCVIHAPCSYKCIVSVETCFCTDIVSIHS